MKATFKERLTGNGFTIPRKSVGQPVGFLVAAVFLAIAIARLPPLWSSLGLLAAMVLILVLGNPLIGLSLALLAGPFGALENVLLGGFILDSGQVLLLLTLASWIGRGMVRRRLVLPATRLKIPLAVFMLAAVLSLPGAISIELGIKELLKWVEIALIAMMVADLARPSSGAQSEEVGASNYLPGRDRILVMLLMAGLLQAAVGIWQFGLRGDGPEHFAILGGFYRAYGTFEQPNPYGGFMNLTALLALGTMIGRLSTFAESLGRRGESSPRVERHKALRSSPGQWLVFAIVLVSSVAATLGLIFSWSRGAWLGFVAGAAVLLLYWPERLRRGLLLLASVSFLCIVVLLVGVRLDMVPAGAIDRLSDFRQDVFYGDVRGVDINDANYAVLERLAHWQASLEMARDHLWLGVGFGNYEAAYATYALINWPDALGHAHNYYLNILAETGVIGLVAYLFLWLVVIRQTAACLKRSRWPDRGVVLGLLAAWVAISLHHLVDKLYVNNMYIHLGVMFGLLHLHQDEE